MRRMAFAGTSDRILDRSKTVTRRSGWRFLAPGDLLLAVDRVRGARAPRVLGVIRVESARMEPLDAVTAEDVSREGFDGLSPLEFVAAFRALYGNPPGGIVTRVEFSYHGFSASGRRSTT